MLKSWRDKLNVVRESLIVNILDLYTKFWGRRIDAVMCTTLIGYDTYTTPII
jgi:hypothetical protein